MAGAVTFVSIAPPAVNGPGPIRMSKPERAP